MQFDFSIILFTIGSEIFLDHFHILPIPHHIDICLEDAFDFPIIFFIIFVQSCVHVLPLFQVKFTLSFEMMMNFDFSLTFFEMDFFEIFLDETKHSCLFQSEFRSMLTTHMVPWYHRT